MSLSKRHLAAAKRVWSRKRSRKSAISKKRISDFKPVRSKKPIFPRRPILTKIHNNQPRKSVRKVPGTDDRFESFDKELTPFARACQIEAEKNEKSPWVMREDFDYSLGSFSVRPANKERIASDEGTDEGLNIVPTEKVIRNAKGIIISTEDSEDDGETYIIASTKYVFDTRDFERVVDTEFSELALSSQPMSGPNKAPIIIDVQCYPGHGTLDGVMTDGWHIQTLIDIGEPSYQVEANWNIVIVCDAYSYIDNDGTRHDEDLTYTWRFTADGMGSAINTVVDSGPVLRLYNLQQPQRGRYTCEVSNEKGISYTRSVYINPIGGILMELDDNGLPTGTYIRDEAHDEFHNQIDSYWDWDEEGKRWYLAEWNGTQWIEAVGINVRTAPRTDRQYKAWSAPKTILREPVKGPQAIANEYAAAWVRKTGKWKFTEKEERKPTSNG